MKPNIAHPRSSDLVQAQLEEFEKIVHDAEQPPPGDIVAELQWRTWQRHRAELKEELEQARLIESQGPEQHSVIAAISNLVEKFRRQLLGSKSAQAEREEKEPVAAGGETAERQNKHSD